MTLDQLKVGTSAVITAVGGDGALRCRLLDMGLIPKTTVEVRKVAPMGDPIEIRIRGYELTIRREDAAKIEVKPEEEKLTYKSVSMAEGIKLMSKDSDFILLDVRRPDEFAAGHIPGAVQLTNESMTKENTAEVLSDKTQKIYVYCRSGRRSKEAS